MGLCQLLVNRAVQIIQCQTLQHLLCFCIYDPQPFRKKNSSFCLSTILLLRSAHFQFLSFHLFFVSTFPSSVLCIFFKCVNVSCCAFSYKFPEAQYETKKQLIFSVYSWHYLLFLCPFVVLLLCYKCSQEETHC